MTDLSKQQLPICQFQASPFTHQILTILGTTTTLTGLISYLVVAFQMKQGIVVPRNK